MPLQITLRGIGDATIVESAIRRRADRLPRYCDRILRCHVTVGSPQHRNGVGRLYNVDILIHVPGEDLIVAHEPRPDIDIALRDAFDTAKRRLQDYVRRRRVR